MLLPVAAHQKALLPALAAALAGNGPPVLPLPPEPRGLLEAMRPHEPIEDEVALVVPTSGSTGEPKGVLLTAANLTASARATEARLGGPAQWLLAIPPTHIGGLQVLVRSLLAGTNPVTLEGPFTAASFATAAARLTGSRRNVSLVPTQLRRLLNAEPGPLSHVDAVLLGGAAADPDLLHEAARQGIRVVTTYGMSETSGGCVYDGRPLDGVSVTLDEGRIALTGDVVGLGYRFGPRFQGRFETSDLGVWRPDGTLQVLGRADDMIVTGGVNVSPSAVEAVLRTHPDVVEAAVTGVADREWGQRVRAFVVLRPEASVSLQDARAHVRSQLTGPEAPRELVCVAALPMLPGGKLDRVALRSWGPHPTRQEP